MTLELQILGWAALLAAAQLVLLTVVANMQVDRRLLVGPRDDPIQMPTATGRLKRAFENHVEGLVIFTPAVLVVTLGGASSPLTQGCAIAYLVARIVYVPVYAMGIPYLRSMVWVVGFLASVTMLIQPLL